MDLLFRLLTLTGTKGCARHVALAAPTNRDKSVLFVPVARPGTKGPFCPGLAVPGGKPGQQEFFNPDKSAFLW